MGGGRGALEAAAVARRVGLRERLVPDELLHEVHVLLARRQLLVRRQLLASSAGGSAGSRVGRQTRRRRLRLALAALGGVAALLAARRGGARRNTKVDVRHALVAGLCRPRGAACRILAARTAVARPWERRGGATQHSRAEDAHADLARVRVLADHPAAVIRGRGRGRGVGVGYNISPAPPYPPLYLLGYRLARALAEHAEAISTL